MNDVFDEELMKELGLTADELKKSGPEKKRAGKPEPGVLPPAPAEVPQKPKSGQVRQPQRQEGEAPSHEPPQSALEEESAQSQALKVTQDVPVQMAAVLAKKAIRLKDVLELKPGEVLDFKKQADDPIDLVANGKLIAKAELVMIEGRLGARIVKLIK